MLDFVQNNNPVPVYRALAAFQDSGEFPEFLENYTFPDTGELRKYSSTAFADPDTRQFPINTQASTLLSAVCYYGQGGGYPEIESEILKAASAQGIAEWVEKSKYLCSPIEKQAHTQDKEYALVLDYGDHQEGYLPIDTWSEVQDSARALSKAISGRALPLTKIAEAAKFIVKKASDLGVPSTSIPTPVHRFAESRLMDQEYAAAQFNLRKRLVDSDTAEIYDEILKAASAADADLDLCTELLEDLDRNHLDFREQAHLGLEDAWCTLHSGMTETDFDKIASTYVFMTFENGTPECPVPVQSLKDIPDALIKSAFRKTESDYILSLKDRPCYEFGAEINTLRDDIKRELLTLAINHTPD